MNKRLYRIGWVIFGAVAVLTGDATAAASGVNSNVCVSLGLLLGLTLLPPEALIEVVMSRINATTDKQEDN
jgi:hypothetical protein